MKIEIINKNEFYKYKDVIDSIHLENAYPCGYLIDGDYLTNADKIVLLFIDNRVVGYASLSKEDIIPDEGSDFSITISPNNIKIKQIAIRKEYQNKGIGTNLINYIKKYAKDNNINYIKKYAKDNNINYIYLYSFSLNEKAKDFYLKNNFVISGVWSALEYKGIKNPKSYFYSYNVK